MPYYSYNALAEDGRTTKGSIEAESVEAANSLLSSKGLMVTNVKEEASAMPGYTWQSLQEQLTPIKAPDLILFTKQFRTMIRAGVSMMQILQILQQQTENLKLKKILGKMQQDVNEGLSLHEAFKKHPKVFSVLYCSMVEAGEASGALPEILDRLTYIIEHEYKVKADIKSALQYPIVVVSFLAIAFIVLLTFVIPKFVNIFTNAGLKLPLPTKICMALYQFMADSWILIIGGLFVFIAVMVLFL
ncbi:MAG: type II secretion system F family protein, partial [Deltaproteobacteria bacterium]|nr:type II secretion system F family protein [Deltaproteobacteria bacterium]